MYIQQTDSVHEILQDSGRIDSLLFLDPEAPLQNTSYKTYPSLFVSSKGDSELRVQDRLPTEHPAWIPLILLLCFVLLAWGRLFFRRRLDMIFRGIFAKNYANQLYREGNLFNERIGLVLFVIYLSTFSLYVYLAIPMIAPGLHAHFDAWIYPVIFASFLALWFLKVAIVNVLSMLFNTAGHSREILSNMYLYNLFAGIVFMPLLCGMAFSNLELFFYISLIIIALIYSIRILREAIIGFTVIKFSVFHLILYLCTLEILPLLILAKVLSINNVLFG